MNVYIITFTDVKRVFYFEATTRAIRRPVEPNIEKLLDISTVFPNPAG